MSPKQKPAFKWVPEIGPAFITGLVQIAAILIGGAMAWTSLQKDVKAANIAIQELKSSATISSDIVARNANRITRTETAIEYIVPSLKRIEDKLTSMSGSR